MRARVALVHVFVLALACTSAARSQEAQHWLRYQAFQDEYWWVQSRLGGQDLKVESQAPEGVRMPELRSATPLFAAWHTPLVAGGRLWLALDQAARSGMPDRLYLDTNADGHLDDEAAIRADSRHDYGSGWRKARVSLPGPDGPVAYHLEIQYYVYTPDERRLLVRSAGWYEGPVRVGAQPWHCFLLDYDANGTFNDVGADADGCDRILLSPHGPEALTRPEEELTEHYAGRYIEAGGEYFEPRPARDGATIAFLPRPALPLGSVRVPAGVTVLSAAGENGLFTVHPAGGQARLPLGRYRVAGWAVERRDAAGKLWRAEARSSEQTFEVLAQREVSLAVGEPLAARVIATSRGGGYSFSHRITGPGQDPVSFTCDGRRPRAPRLRIRNDAGDYSTVLQFEYG